MCDLQTISTFVAFVGSTVLLEGGAQACNIYYQVSPALKLLYGTRALRPAQKLRALMRFAGRPSAPLCLSLFGCLAHEISVFEPNYLEGVLFHAPADKARS